MANLEESPLFDEERPPVEMEDEDLTFDLLEHVMPGDHVYFALGSALSHIGDITAIDAEDIKDILASMLLLGELAEKPGKVDSKISRLKTRNYSISSKRISSIELNLVGISDKVKNYLETALFQEQDVTILITDAMQGQRVVEIAGSRCLLLDSMRWTVDWSAEADGLWSVVISTTVNGITANKILPFTTLAIPEE